MGERRDTSGKQVRARTAIRGKRYLCAKCRKRAPQAVITPAPWYCEKCLAAKEAREAALDPRNDPS